MAGSANTGINRANGVTVGLDVSSHNTSHFYVQNSKSEEIKVELCSVLGDMCF